MAAEHQPHRSGDGGSGSGSGSAAPTGTTAQAAFTSSVYSGAQAQREQMQLQFQQQLQAQQQQMHRLQMQPPAQAQGGASSSDGRQQQQRVESVASSAALPQVPKAGATGVPESPPPPQLYKTSKMRRPELWQFIRLVAPDPPDVAAGKTYTNQDAKEAYCLKCKRIMHYNTGSSNNVSRHMAKFHANDLASFAKQVADKKTTTKKQQQAAATASTREPTSSNSSNASAAGVPSPSAGHKRKLQPSTSTAVYNPSQIDGSRSQPVQMTSTAARKRARGESGSPSEQQYGQTIAGTGDMGFISYGQPQQTAGASQNLTLAETEQLNALVARWVAKHYHPFGITEDRELQELLHFAATLRKPVALPPPSTVRASVESLSARKRMELLRQVSSEVLFFSMATEVWTTTARDVFVSLSIHYLTEGFERRHFTLDVREHNGQQLSPEAKKEMLDALLARWNLDSRYLSSMLWQSQVRDEDANNGPMLQPHARQVESAAHAFELILAPLLHARKDLEEDGMQVFFFDEMVNEAVANVPFEFQPSVQFVCSQVGFFRDLAFFLTNHPRAVVRLGKLMAGTSPVRLVTDSKASWLSTLDMLKRLVKKRDVIRDFFAYLEASEGRVEFPHGVTSSASSGDASGVRRRAPSAEQWCAVECLLQLLQPFENVALAIGKEKYASSSLTFPLLRFLKRDLEKVSDFQRVFARNRSYAGGDFARSGNAATGENNERPQLSDDAALALSWQGIATHMEAARNFLYMQFMLHFARSCDELMWVSQLDPRFVRMKYLSEDEREACKSRLVEQCFRLATFLQAMASQRYKVAVSAASTTGRGATAVGAHGLDPSGASAAFLDFQGTRDDQDASSFLRELLFDDAHDEAALVYQQQQQQQQQAQFGGPGSLGPSPTGATSSSSDPATGGYVEPETTLRLRVLEEVQLYYEAVASAKVAAMRDPLKWWRDNSLRFPLLVPLARQWLGSVGSVRPSEAIRIGVGPHGGPVVAPSSSGAQAGGSAGGFSGVVGPTGTHAVHSEPELVRDLVFVHDNC